MKLYSYWRSSSSWRVRIALSYKNIDHDLQPVHLLREGGEQHAQSYQTMNAMEQVPVLEWEENGTTRHLSQSMAILEYLDEQFPSPPLLPKDRWDRARVRQLAETINSGIQPLHNLAVMSWVRDQLQGDERGWAQAWAERGLIALEKMAEKTAGKYSVGDTVTLADVCLVPELYAARRFGVRVEPFATLMRIEDACQEMPAFQSTHPSAQPDAVPGS